MSRSARDDIKGWDLGTTNPRLQHRIPKTRYSDTCVAIVYLDFMLTMGVFSCIIFELQVRGR